MEVTESSFKQILAVITGDAGGFASSGSPAFLRQIVRSGDSESLSLNDYPALEVDINSRNISPVTATAEMFDCVVSFIVTTNRDPGNFGIASPDGTIIRASLDAVLARIITVFGGTTLTALVDPDDSGRKWYFEPMFRALKGSPQSTSARVRQAVSYRLYANKGTV